jgi:hypothetical protein
MRLFTLLRRHYGPEADPVSGTWGLGNCHTLVVVNRRSFYWRSKSDRGRRLLVEWRAWLGELQRHRWVWWLPRDDDPVGWRLLNPVQAAPLAMQAGVLYPADAMSRYECDQRFQRAVKQVLATYRLDRADTPDGAVRISVRGPASAWEVRVRLDGSEPPACTCPDAIHRRPMHGGFCKHTVAALLTWPDLRCQLLTAIL